MGNALSIAGGIALGGFFSLVGYAGLSSLAEYDLKKELKDHKNITGIVIEENFITKFLDSSYQVSIRTPDGKKVVVNYDSITSHHEPRILNTLFAPGNEVELYVATNNDFKGDQRFVGLTGKLVQDKTK